MVPEVENARRRFPVRPPGVPLALMSALDDRRSRRPAGQAACRPDVASVSESQAELGVAEERIALPIVALLPHSNEP